MNLTAHAVRALTALSLALGVCGCGNSQPQQPDRGGVELVGLFRFDPAAYLGPDKAPTGTWFQMLTPAGGVMSNANPGSPVWQVNGKPVPGAYTSLAPGVGGGLRAGGYQSLPDPAFAGTPTDPKAGDSLADSVTQPTPFFLVKFSISTNATDPQTQRPVGPPKVLLRTDGTLAADLSSWAATWNGQYFNQGAPKPRPAKDAQVQGAAQVKQVWDWAAQKFLDAPVADNIPQGDWATGSYDPATRHYSLQWRSLIVGGPFDKFTGLWHLEGVFEPSTGPVPHGPSS
ncbi:conserved hypothetical protein [Segniliparus rotundus DSM 44985]|uniref:Uncharacterized protein n=1 Tax=Segniliparus rotundus (strain ATCC BAA-972 / CDC 1076 / CIP 108378 / DSM 44985 / JCM 13578) TaxID=640132 RepID=D6ZB57_SEGRD|nr:hypothetical protein [Segniliparus rotundus]ADG96816.1 conserved hypothetical protein [Segniliparus rotundus DSM 44985]